MPPTPKPDTPPKSAKATAYEISKWRAGTPAPATSGPAAATSSGAPKHGPSWEPVGTLETARGALHAIKEWAESQGEKFTGGRLRAVPIGNITERQVDVETKRQLTLGAPDGGTVGA